MAQASRDENRVTTLLAVSNVDGVTPVAVYADPVTHRLLVSSNATISIGTSVSGGTAGSVLFVGATGLLAQDNTNFVWDTTNANLRIGPTSAAISSENRLSVIGNANDYHGIFVENKSAGVSASTDIVAGNDLSAADMTTYVDFGVNSSTNSAAAYTAFPVNGAYLYTSGQVSDLTIGTGVANKVIKFITGGTLVANERARITSTGMTLGLAGNTLGTLQLSGNTSGTTSVVPAAAASGTLTLPAATDTVAVLATAQAFTNKTYNGLTLTSTTGTFTLTAAKTFAVTNTLTLSGTDSTVMTFPTISKTIAANDGSNWTIAGQAIGDIPFASSTTAYGKIAAVAVGSVLVSAGTGTQPVWSAGPQLTTVELGAATDTTLSRVSAGVIAVEGVTVATASNTLTLTNKRVTRRSASTAGPGATPTTNSDNVDLQIFTALAANITSMTTNLSGTPVTGDFLEFWFTDNGTPRTITFGASFAATTVALPTTTVTSTKLRVLFEWGGSTWDCVATA